MHELRFQAKITECQSRLASKGNPLFDSLHALLGLYNDTAVAKQQPSQNLCSVPFPLVLRRRYYPATAGGGHHAKREHHTKDSKEAFDPWQFRWWEKTANETEAIVADVVESSSVPPNNSRDSGIEISGKPAQKQWRTRAKRQRDKTVPMCCTNWTKAVSKSLLPHAAGLMRARWN